jgi:hypothetical protein
MSWLAMSWLASGLVAVGWAGSPAQPFSMNSVFGFLNGCAADRGR